VVECGYIKRFNRQRSVRKINRFLEIVGRGGEIAGEANPLRQYGESGRERHQHLFVFRVTRKSCPARCNRRREKSGSRCRVGLDTRYLIRRGDKLYPAFPASPRSPLLKADVVRLLKTGQRGVRVALAGTAVVALSQAELTVCRGDLQLQFLVVLTAAAQAIQIPRHNF